jgi:hypothetical protein
MFHLPQELQNLIWEYDGRWQYIFSHSLLIIKSAEPMTSIWENEYALYGNPEWRREFLLRAKAYTYPRPLGYTITSCLGVFRVYTHQELRYIDGNAYLAVKRDKKLLPAYTLCRCQARKYMMRKLVKLEQKRAKLLYKIIRVKDF